MRYIEVSGEPFERGRAHGKQAADQIRQGIELIERLSWLDGSRTEAGKRLMNAMRAWLSPCWARHPT